MVKESNNKSKKYSAYWADENGKRSRLTSFGAKGMDDYTAHHDEKRKTAYLKRHGGREEDGYATSSREDWGVPKVGEPIPAGWLSRYLLWSEKSLKRAAREIEETQGIKVVLDLGLLGEE